MDPKAEQGCRVGKDLMPGNGWFTHAGSPTMSEEKKTQPLDVSNLKATYANICRIAQTPSEILIDFGLNPNFYGMILEEPARLEQRVILTHDTAKRLCLHLTAAIQSYEARYGVIELDLAKRLKGEAEKAQ